MRWSSVLTAPSRITGRGSVNRWAMSGMTELSRGRGGERSILVLRRCRNHRGSSRCRARRSRARASCASMRCLDLDAVLGEVVRSARAPIGARYLHLPCEDGNDGRARQRRLQAVGCHRYGRFYGRYHQDRKGRGHRLRRAGAARRGAPSLVAARGRRRPAPLRPAPDARSGLG